MVLYPNAKINLGLNVVRKRSDGFHDLETVFYPIPLCDALEIVESDGEGVEFSSSGIGIPGSEGGNLVENAYTLLKKDHKLPGVKIHLHKRIPIGAGLGGGSSDASYTLKGLNALFELGISDEQLEKYAGELGSDCPFFIKNKAVFAQGKGDEFSPCSVDLKAYSLVLVCPDVHVSTAQAYGGVVPSIPQEELQKVICVDPHDWKESLKNDFETSVFSIYPQIEKIKNHLYQQGATYASMSGSGSSVFALFKTEPKDLVFKNARSWTWNLDQV